VITGLLVAALEKKLIHNKIYDKTGTKRQKKHTHKFNTIGENEKPMY
jgi:hypothetical protein